MFAFFAISGALAAVLASFFAKLWVVQDKWYFYALAATLFFIGGNLGIFAIKHGGISITTFATQMLRLILASGVGLLYFHEKLTTQQTIGMALAVPAIILLVFPFK